jgi:hypothetical protein
LDNDTAHTGNFVEGSIPFPLRHQQNVRVTRGLGGRAGSASLAAYEPIGSIKRPGDVVAFASIHPAAPNIEPHQNTRKKIVPENEDVNAFSQFLDFKSSTQE